MKESGRGEGGTGDANAAATASLTQENEGEVVGVGQRGEPTSPPSNFTRLRCVYVYDMRHTFSLVCQVA